MLFPFQITCGSRVVLPGESSKCPQHRDSWDGHQHLLPTAAQSAQSAHSSPVWRSAHAWDSAALSCLLLTASCQPTRDGDGRVPAPSPSSEKGVSKEVGASRWCCDRAGDRSHHPRLGLLVHAGISVAPELREMVERLAELVNSCLLS